MKTILTTLLLSASSMAIGQTQISDYRPGVTAEGAVYYLPKTGARIAVKVEKTTYTPGDFCKYAERYLRLDGVKTKPSVSHRVIDCRITPYGEADKTKAFAVKFNAKSAAANIRLADDGRLLAVNAEPSAEKAFVPFAAARKQPVANPRDYMSQDILSAGSTTKMAELTAREIYDIRESKNALNRGEADFMPKDGEQLRIMLANLDTQDRSLSSLFSGVTTIDTTEVVFTVCPEREVERQVLFRLSRQLGMVDADDLSGSPYYITVKNLNATPDEAPLDGKKKREKEDGIYVNVPGKISVAITTATDTVASTEFHAGQFGHVELLSGDLFNKRFTTRLKLNPTTGGVEKLDAEQPK
ncbi:MAG: DUF4831 family protein [Prevotellaceae bacterium]|nr:DUF4831 family protein [Prevotellaceae bacterium]